MAQASKGTIPARPKSRDAKGQGKGAAPSLPSPFGSHATMVNEELTGKILAEKQDTADPWTILTDERGSYATRQSRLDSGLADPARAANQPARDAQLAEFTKPGK
ncbi:hypothetical protein HQ590_06700 [bacterium]|nr:hypothetical protein [bacterium]